MRWPTFLLASRGRVRLRGVRTAKTTAAAVLAWLAALPLSDNPRPVLAPLTALLVVQLTLYDTLRSGLRRVVSVVCGVLLAVALADAVQIHWWSLGLVIAASLVLGRVLRLGDHLLEVPISAMLVLAVGGNDATASGRITETVIGAAVGVTVAALVAPPLYVRPAGDAVESLAGATAVVLRRVADDVRGEYTREQAGEWLDQARGLGRDILRADRALERADESLRLNPRAVSKAWVRPSLRSGLDALERAAVSLRSLCRSLADRAGTPGPEPVYADDVRAALHDLLHRVAEVVETYGGLVGSEVSGPSLEARPEDALLRSALTQAWAERDRLVGLLRAGGRLETDAWELDGSLAANIDRLLHDLDVEVRAELRADWPTRAPRPRPVASARARLRRGAG